MLKETVRSMVLVACVLGVASPASAGQFGRVLQIVYFTPADREPVEGYRERLDRVMGEVQSFYGAGMAARGFGAMTFPLERGGDGRVVIHLVKGKHETDFYTGERGDELRREAVTALAKEGIDADRETIVIFENLVHTEGDHLSADCPYYGGGDHKSGTAWVTDHAVLDALNLTKTEPIIYDGDRRYSVGKYNSVYIGGVTHELGHALGLPHVRATRDEATMGTSLMGSGNYTFREEARCEGKGTFLSRASALALSTHPLFRRSDEGKDLGIECTLTRVRGEPIAGGMLVHGQVATSMAPIGLIAFTDPDGGSDYDSLTSTARVDPQGRFSVRTGEFRPGGYELRLTFCYPTGATISFPLPFSVDDRGFPDHRALEPALLKARAVAALIKGDSEAARAFALAAVEKVESIPEALLTDGLRAIARKSASLTDLASAKPTTEPGPAPAALAGHIERAFLSDLTWESAEVGWEKPCRDRIPGEEGPGWLESGEGYHSHGLYAHAPSRYVFRLGGAWARFTSACGLQQGAQGSVVFVVLGDGRELYRSAVVKDFRERPVDLDVSGVDVLELVVDEAEFGNYQDCSVWFSPEIAR